MKKKFFNLTLVMVMVLGSLFLLTGCGNKEENKNSSSASESQNRNNRDGLKVGDYVDYKYDVVDGYTIQAQYSGNSGDQTISQDELTWRIYNIDQETGRVDLISTTATSEKIYLNGALGYNNGVNILNEAAEKLYSNSSLGIKARSINLEDLESKYTDQAKAEKMQYIKDETQYGNTKTYTGKTYYYPSIYEEESGSGINTSTINENGYEQSYNNELTTEKYKQTDTITAKQTEYNFTDNLRSVFDLDTYKILYSDTSDFWIATRGVSNIEGFTDEDDYIEFGLFRTHGGDVTSQIALQTAMANSKGKDGTWPKDAKLRVIVSIDGNTAIEAKEGTLSSMHEIK